MENKNEKTAAELYREERKQRLAKAAKKNSKKSPQLNKAGRIAGKCIGIAIVVALAILVIHSVLSFAGLENRYIFKAMKVGKQSISVAKYNFYYLNAYYEVRNQADQYDNYYGAGSGLTYTGFDSSKTPKNQACPASIEGYQNPTWDDYFDYSARMQIQMYTAFADLAKKNGITVTDEQKAELEDTINQLKAYAKEQDFSLGRYISKRFGNGVNEKVLRDIYEEQYLAQNYVAQVKENTENSITAEEINKKKDDSFRDYAVFNIAYFKVKADIPATDENGNEPTEEAKAAAMTAAKAKADEIIAKSESIDVFTAEAAAYDEANTASTVLKSKTNAETIGNLIADAPDWIFASDRAAGDKNVFETTDGYYVVYLVTLPDVDRTKGVDVRHILVQFDTQTDESGNQIALTDEQKVEYKEKAEEILAEFNQNPTAENFAALAEKYSEDSGSSSNGGLYEAVYPGKMVEEFDNWIFDESRKPGDTDIIETTYGYHVMYYVGNDHDESWYVDVKADLVDEKTNLYYDNTMALPEYQVKLNNKTLASAKKSIDSFISKILATSSTR